MHEIKKTLVILFTLGLLFTGCSDNGESNTVALFDFNDPDYGSLLKDITDLQEAVSFDQVLNNNPERQYNLIDTALNKARAGLLVLAKDGDLNNETREKAYYQFADALQQYDNYGILEFEQDRFDRVFKQVRFLKFTLARDLELTADKDTWTIYDHNFSTAGLEPEFSTLGYTAKGEPNDESKWFTNFQIDLPKARAQGRDGANGWLISRPFDLSSINNPQFRHFGSYLVVAPNNFAPLSVVLKNVFKTYILIDYKSGDNPDNYPDSRKILVEYDLDDLPLGRDFHDEWSPLVSLEEHKAKGEISIAYFFDSRAATYKSERNGEEIDVKFTQYYSWTLFDFEIRGSGKIEENFLKYKKEFSGNTFGTFKSYSLEFPGGNWGVKKGRAIINSTGEESIDTFLLSPRLDIPKEMINPNLVIRESLFGENFTREDLDNLEILISTDFKGGQSPLKTQWEVLNRGLDTKAFNSKSKILMNEITVPLNDFSGEEITIAFRFRSEARDSQRGWGIESLRVFGMGGEITEIDYLLDNPSDAFALASYVMANQRVSDFVIESEDNAPSWKKEKDNFVISGFNPGEDPSTGLVRLTLPKIIDLSNRTDARMRMRHKVFFFKDRSVSEEVVKVQIRIAQEDLKCGIDKTDPLKCEVSKWEDLEFPRGTFRDKMPRSPELSKWASIDSKYLGRKVQISFRYKAQKANGGTVEWTLNSVEVGAK